MEFESFTRKSARLTREPTITIQKKGVMGLNSSAYEALKRDNEEIDEKLPVELLFDKEEQVVGLRVTEENNPDAYMVRRQKLSPSYLVAGRMFFVHYGVPIGETRRYKARMYGEDVLGFSLKQEPRVTARDP